MSLGEGEGWRGGRGGCMCICVCAPVCECGGQAGGGEGGTCAHFIISRLIAPVQKKSGPLGNRMPF